MSLKKQALDQFGHFSVGFLITYLLAFFMPVWFAAASVMGIAVLREKFQHRMKTLFQLGIGSVIDLSFWLLGVGLAVGLILSEVL